MIKTITPLWIGDKNPVIKGVGFSKSSSKIRLWFFINWSVVITKMRYVQCWPKTSWAENLGNHPCYLKTFMILGKKKIENGPLKKTTLFQTVNSQYFFAKLSGMGPWVSRIDWCEGYWFGSTYIAVRLSNIRPKTGKICIFHVFRLFLRSCQTVSRPYRLCQTNALRINQFY